MRLFNQFRYVIRAWKILMNLPHEHEWVKIFRLLFFEMLSGAKVKIGE